MKGPSFHWVSVAAGILAFGAALMAQQGQQGPPARQGGEPQGQRQGGAAAGGQGRQGGPIQEFTNLTVLPRDIPQQQLIQIMQGFEGALGVECDHCHVYAGRGNPMNDMASDAKPTKKTTRLMMIMARDFNNKLIMDVGKPAAQVTRVQCGTCHRGSPIPAYDPPPLPPPAAGRAGSPAGGA